jgi:N-acetylmuramoyl-L-alanine amidase/Mannosyl-glycoprotein endo-beta-N-acetylglucosaminidase
MGRILISAGHGGLENGLADPGAIVAGTTEAREMIAIRDALAVELRSRNLEVLIVPDDLSLAQTIAWINGRAKSTDVALEIHAGAAANSALRGAAVFYIANNDQRKAHANLLIKALLAQLPALPLRGIFPDTTGDLGSITFCRQLASPSLLLEIAMLTNPTDREILQTQRAKVAQGLADGLVAWNNAVSGLPTPSPTPTYESIKILLNGQTYGEQGILVNGNAFIPIDLVDRLGIDVTTDNTVRKVDYRKVTFVRAADLRNFNITVGWDNPNRTVILQSILKICPGTIDRIMGHGHTSKEQLNFFLKSNNEAALAQYPDLAEIYRREGAIEGVSYDIAFCQMCLETNFLRFGGVVKASQNNFAGMGDVSGGPEGASFASAQIGVRAHIQLLKAYATTEPLVQDNANPRFRFITRGIAPLVAQLSGRWAADPQYGDKIIALLRRLYESAKLLTADRP